MAIITNLRFVLKKVQLLSKEKSWVIVNYIPYPQCKYDRPIADHTTNHKVKRNRLHLIDTRNKNRNSTFKKFITSSPSTTPPPRRFSHFARIQEAKELNE